MSTSACPSCSRNVSGATCSECGACLESLVFGAYRADQLIGSGGMGRVYKATHLALGRPVCVKTLLPHLADDAPTVARFEREARLAAAVRHPNLVAIHDVGRDAEGVPFMVMEFVEGKSLRELLLEEAPLEPQRAIALIDQVLAGIGEAHAHGIVHRDLKPANVLVMTLSDGSELCKVVDFGIARTFAGEHTDHRLTRTGLVVGTPGFMAPEQISTGEFDHRVDLYAVGSLLYELCTGTRPIRAASEAELLMRTLIEDPPPPSSRVSSQLPVGLDRVILKALARKPDERFGSATEFRQALRGQQAPAPGFVVEHTCLAAAVASPSQEANPRALFASIVNAKDAWERNHLMEPFGRAVEQAIVRRLGEQLTALFRHVSEVSKSGVALEDVRAELVEVFTRQLFGLVEWLKVPQLAHLAMWMLRLVGPSAIARLFFELESVGVPERAARIAAIRELASSTVLLRELRDRAPSVLRLFVQDCARWPEQRGIPFVVSATQLPSPEHRVAALESLDEVMAFRCLRGIRARLHDPHAKVRAAALRWVWRLGDEGAVRDLATLLRRPGTAASERRSIYQALARLGASGLSALTAAVATESEQSVTGDLVQLLARSEMSGGVRAIRGMVSDPNTPPRLRRLCTEQMKQLTELRRIADRPTVIRE